MSGRETVLGDIADGELTVRVELGAPERHMAISWDASPLGIAIDRLQAEQQSKDMGYEFSADTARAVCLELWLKGLDTFKNDAGPVGERNGRRLALIAIMIRNPLRCPQCKGVGSLWHRKVPVAVCDQCLGAKYEKVDQALVRKAYGRDLDAREQKVLQQMLLLWDQNEHSSSDAVGNMYRGVARKPK